MKLRICLLVMSMAALFYYGFAHMAPAARNATVSSAFHQLGKNALTKIEAAQDAASDTEYQTRIAAADLAFTTAQRAIVSGADQAEFARLLSYMQAVKQDHMLAQTASDPSQQPDHEQTNAARANAENTFR
ncbi:MAG TPA: hypothetical protein VM912_14025 [Terriglobales bacterium]|nr:hypothetical protein [Terriglobales bacterium]